MGNKCINVSPLLIAAFGENKESGMNYPTYSLTPCLKIRNMFDADM